MAILQSDRAIDYMRDAGKKALQTLVEIKHAVKPGIRTFELEKITERYRSSARAASTFINCEGFSHVICFSLSRETAHGVAGLEKLQNGDNISIDVGTVINGFNGGFAKAFPFGRAGAKMQKLLEVTEQNLYNGTKIALAINCYGGISSLFQVHGESYGYRIVRNYVGHGIGKPMHEDPQIPNYGSAGRGPRLKSGMTLAIEPMINLGTHEVKTLDDEWTVITKECKPSAIPLQ